MKTSLSNNPLLPKNYFLFIIFIILAVQTAGCSFKVRLVGEYDEITDQAVTELHKKTKVFFLKLQRASGQEAAYEANKGFYEGVSEYEQQRVVQSCIMSWALTNRITIVQLSIV